MPSVKIIMRVWVLWNNDNISVQVLLKEQSVIHILIKDKFIQKECLKSAIYEPAQEIEKGAFWNHLTGINILDVPRCVIGDLYEIECLSDKIGDTHLSLDKVVCMQTFFNSINGESAPTLGHLFT